MHRDDAKPKRRESSQVLVGNVRIGGGAPVSVQSMTCTKTEDILSTVDQILRLEQAGCDIVRVAVSDRTAAAALGAIKKSIRIPLVADIAFDHRLALASLDQGVDKIRINPGNIGSPKKIREILVRAGEGKVPIRIGVNSGSLEKPLLRKHGGVTAAALAESVLGHVRFFEDSGFSSIVVSIKASGVPMMIAANRIVAEKVPYPIHLGVTEAGPLYSGTIRSAVGIGALLAVGVGDTIRVSLTGDPKEEVRAGLEILKSLGLKSGLTLISCPTCGRLQTDLSAVVESVEKALVAVRKSVTVALMGCAVNGPGEACQADIGIACGRKSAVLFRKGKIIRKIREKDIVATVLEEVGKWKE